MLADDAAFMSIADRSILSCWGLMGGRAGAPFRVTVDPDTADERVMEGLCDREPVANGSIIRVETTGGGGWGDPLDRDVDAVALDVLQGKVTRDGATSSYGVVFVGPTSVEVDHAATATTRSSIGRCPTVRLDAPSSR